LIGLHFIQIFMLFLDITIGEL